MFSMKIIIQGLRGLIVNLQSECMEDFANTKDALYFLPKLISIAVSNVPASWNKLHKK